MLRPRSFLTAVVATLLLAALAACASAAERASGPESFEALVEASLGGLPGVESMSASQTPVDGSTPEDALDADAWSLDVEVVMTPEAAVDEVARAAEATHDLVEDHVGAARWTARVVVGAEDIADDGMPAQPRVQIEVFPRVRQSAAEDARAAMEVAAMPVVTTVGIAGGFPSVHVAQVADLPATFDGLGRLALWSAGGSLWSHDGRVRLTDVPDRVTDAVVAAIFAAAAECPEGQFWLEAPKDGPQWPELYVDHVTRAQADSIQASFTDSALAVPAIESFLPDFNIRVSDESGVTDLHGTFGVRVGDSEAH